MHAVPTSWAHSIGVVGDGTGSVVAVEALHALLTLPLANLVLVG